MPFHRTARASLPILPWVTVSTFLLSPFAARAAERVTPPAGDPPIVLVEDPAEEGGFTGYLARRQVTLGGPT